MLLYSMIKCDIDCPSQPNFEFISMPRHSLFALLAFALVSSSPAPAIAEESKAFSDLTAPLEIVVERDRSRVAAAKRLARLYAEAGRWDDAWRVLELSASHAKSDAEYQGFAGTVLRQLKRAAEAADYFRHAIALQPEEGRWWIGLGLALEDAGQWKAAKQAFAGARDREQTLSPALLKLAEKRSR